MGRWGTEAPIPLGEHRAESLPTIGGTWGEPEWGPKLAYLLGDFLKILFEREREGGRVHEQGKQQQEREKQVPH